LGIVRVICGECQGSEFRSEPGSNDRETIGLCVKCRRGLNYERAEIKSSPKLLMRAREVDPRKEKKSA
jgi:hypothetical protein